MSDDDRFTTEWIPPKVHDTNDAQELGHLGDVETMLRCINILAAEVERLTARVERLDPPQTLDLPAVDSLAVAGLIVRREDW